MQFPKNEFEISLEDVSVKLTTDQPFIILDVREPYEVSRMPMEDQRVVTTPLSQLSALGTAIFPNAVLNKGQEIIVICQEGARSLSIAVWLRRNGWTNVLSMQGGMAGFTYMKGLGKGPKQAGSV